MAVHAFKKHERINSARHFVHGVQCLWCLKHYASQIHLTNHVKRRQECMDFYRAQPRIVDPAPGVNSRAVNASCPSLLEPFFQAEGPHMLATTDGLGDPIVQAEENRLWSALGQVVKPPFSLDFGAGLKRVLQTTFLYPDEVIAILKRFVQHVHDAECCTALQCLQLAESAQFFSLEWVVDVEGTWKKADHIDVMQTFDLAASSLERMECPRRYAPRYDPIVFAHLFSGRRRPGDFQEAVEALGLLGGPPCETWSRARGRQLRNGKPGPRRVRSVLRPQGRLDLKYREDVQVRFGSRLLGVAIRLLYIAALTGATAVLERPAEDVDDVSQPSIWKLPVLRTLLRFECCRKFRVLQGWYGATSYKPTELFFVNVCAEAEEMFLQARQGDLPKAISIGQDEAGNWRTTHLKEYPPAFCAVLGRVFAASQPRVAEVLPIPNWFSEVCDELIGSFDLEAGMGQDFCNPEKFANY